jgi:hypothetical protein
MLKKDFAGLFSFALIKNCSIVGSLLTILSSSKFTPLNTTYKDTLDPIPEATLRSGDR